MHSRRRAVGTFVVRLRDEIAGLAMFAIGQAMVWTVSPGGDTLLHGSRPWNAIVLAVTDLSLAWRRRAPLGALVTAVLAFCGTHVVVPHGIPFLPGFFPIIVLTASAGWYLRGRRSVFAVAFAVVLLGLAEISEPTMRQPEHVWDVLWLAAPWGLLRAVRVRDERVRRLAAELATMEATQEAARRDVLAAERARIARDLHDVVAHATSVMVIQIGAARMQHSAGEAEIGEQLAAAETTGRQAIAELRRLLDVLREWPDEAMTESGPADPQPPQPLLAELGALADSYRSAGLAVELEVCVPDDVLLGVQVSAYRIVQEALTNSLRHGGGRPVSVRVEVRDDQMTIDVTDRWAPSGTVTPPSGPELVSGHGLIGMAERARLLGGELTAGPNLFGGWTVLARIPVAEQPTRRVPA